MPLIGSQAVISVQLQRHILLFNNSDRPLFMLKRSLSTCLPTIPRHVCFPSPAHLTLNSAREENGTGGGVNGGFPPPGERRHTAGFLFGGKPRRTTQRIASTLPFSAVEILSIVTVVQYIGVVFRQYWHYYWCCPACSTPADGFLIFSEGFFFSERENLSGASQGCANACGDG